MGKTFQLTFEQPRNNSIGFQLKELIDVLTFIKNNPDPEVVVLDLGQLSFVHPILILAISAIRDNLSRSGCVISTIKPKKENCSSYLDKIMFPMGLRLDDVNWLRILNHYKDKSYLPILNFSTSSEPPMTEIREKVLSKISTLISKHLALDTNYKNAVTYLISEMTDNILDHSNVERGWMLTQYYPNTEYLDICIIDTGITILGSYRQHGFTDINTDQEALSRALAGTSTKNKDRGTGLRTSRAIAIAIL